MPDHFGIEDHVSFQSPFRHPYRRVVKLVCDRDSGYILSLGQLFSDRTSCIPIHTTGHHAAPSGLQLDDYQATLRIPGKEVCSPYEAGVVDPPTCPCQSP